MRRIFLQDNVYRKSINTDIILLGKSNMDNTLFLRKLIDLKLDASLEVSIPGLWGILEIPKGILNQETSAIQISTEGNFVSPEMLISKIKHFNTFFPVDKDSVIKERFISFSYLDFIERNEQSEKQDIHNFGLTVFLRPTEKAILYNECYNDFNKKMEYKVIQPIVDQAGEKELYDRRTFRLNGLIKNKHKCNKLKKNKMIANSGNLNIKPVVKMMIIKQKNKNVSHSVLQ